MWHYQDWEYLLVAYGRGGACSVPCPAIRASLVKAGLMTPAKAPACGGWKQPEVFFMALTKRGRLRAEEIREQHMTERRRKWERRLLHLAMTKQKPSRRWGPKWRSHPSRYDN